MFDSAFKIDFSRLLVAIAILRLRACASVQLISMYIDCT